MLSSTCQGAELRQSLSRETGDVGGGERRHGFGVQEWSDESRYEGEFVNGFKHGKGRYTWKNGEFYEGSFYKDYRHGGGCYCWPTGHQFTGKFYLNRKEGYGQQEFPDGVIFRGLYYIDRRLGPGVVSYVNGCQDVGLWLGEHLIQLCTSVTKAFSLKKYPEYASFTKPTFTPDSPTQSHMDKDLLSDESFIFPDGMESYSTNGDYLPLPSGRKKELDKHFYGDQWVPDIDQHQGYKRDPLSNLPLRPRMQAHIHKYRLQAESLDWDVTSIISFNRQSFGPKGPLEFSSEQFIQHASRGDLNAISQIIQSRLVHPDVADSSGHTALIAATASCHNHVIQLLLDMGADIDKLNCEGMSALAVCHVLYYPFGCLHTALIETPAKCSISNFNTGTCLPDRPETNETTHNSKSPFSDLTTTEFTKDVLCQSREFSCDSERELHIKESETSTCSDHVQQERKEKTREFVSEVRIDSSLNDGQSRKNQEWKTDESGENKKVVDDLSDSSVSLKLEERQDVDSVEDREEEPTGTGVERCLQVMDGPIALGSVQWKDASPSKRKDKDIMLDSACSVSSFNIQVTEELMQRSAEMFSRAGFHQHCDTQETVRRMAAMKIKHRTRLTTMMLLLERGADPNKAWTPMPVLFLAVMAADTEMVKKLLLCGARTDIPLPPERKGLYPLHVAAALPETAGPQITELLLHSIIDPDALTCEQQDKECNATKSQGSKEISCLEQGGRTALHIACQRESEYQNACRVVALLLSHRARTDLLWAGHSPLSLAIESGNDLAVEILLKGGADPNLPLGRMVGNALCALSNVNSHFSGNRLHMLEMLAEAGADILIPVMVGDVIGTAVDYAHHAFKQDARIAKTPFHALNMYERETFNTQRQLLSKMGQMVRHAIEQKMREQTSSGRTAGCENSPKAETVRKPGFRFCYYCGRSISVKLIVCGRCHMVFYCSKSCKAKAWDQTHKEECARVSGGNQRSSPNRHSGARQKSYNRISPPERIQKSVVFKASKSSRSLKVMQKSKIATRTSDGVPTVPASPRLHKHHENAT